MLTDEEKTAQDRDWSLKVAEIAVGTLTLARPPILALTPEQVERITEIVAEEIFIRLVIGDRPPT